MYCRSFAGVDGLLSLLLQVTLNSGTSFFIFTTCLHTIFFLFDNDLNRTCHLIRFRESVLPHFSQSTGSFLFWRLPFFAPPDSWSTGIQSIPLSLLSSRFSCGGHLGPLRKSHTPTRCKHNFLGLSQLQVITVLSLQNKVN